MYTSTIHVNIHMHACIQINSIHVRESRSEYPPANSKLKNNLDCKSLSLVQLLFVRKLNIV